MLEIAIMLEGQNGLNWARWQRIAVLVEDLGFAGLFRSDHFTNASPPDRDSLDLWISLAWLASHTQRIEFGPLVTPVSFRHPVHSARMAIAVDDLSGGRLVLGAGAGWQEREHEKFGFDLLEIGPRFQRFREGLEVMTCLLNSSEPVTFVGEYYQLHEAILLPRPQRPGGPRLLIGGNGPERTLPLAAKYAGEWNGVYLNPEAFSKLNTRLDELCEEQGRSPGAVRRSVMVGCEYDEDRQALAEKVSKRTGGKRTIDDLRKTGVIVGNGAEFKEQLGAMEAAGVQRVMLQWLDLDDLAGLESLARKLH